MALAPAKYRAYLYDRGGKRRILALPHVTAYMWSRSRDDISTAEAHMQFPSRAEAREVAKSLIRTRYELVIYRGSARVWEGPLTRVAIQGLIVHLYARDVLHYAYRTVMRAGYDNSGTAATTALARINTVMQAELARKEALNPPINVLPHLQVIQRLGDSRTARKTEPRQSTVWEDMDSLAHRGGVDYVVVGRRVVLWDTHFGLGETQVVTEADFIGDIIITEYGMDLCTEDTVTDGQGHWATAGGVDPYYGWVEILHTAYDEADGGPLPTVEEMGDQAVRNLEGRNPTPIEVRVPDGSQINPAGVWTLESLVPGNLIPLRTSTAAVDLVQVQKLDDVMVRVNEEGEMIQVTMSPAVRDEDA